MSWEGVWYGIWYGPLDGQPPPPVYSIDFITRYRRRGRR